MDRKFLDHEFSEGYRRGLDTAGEGHFLRLQRLVRYTLEDLGTGPFIEGVMAADLEKLQKELEG